MTAHIGQKSNWRLSWLIPLINFKTGNMSDPDMNLTSSSSLDLVTSPSPPVYLFTMMGIWASLTGLLGIVANILAIGVFIRVKRVITQDKAVG